MLSTDIQDKIRVIASAEQVPPQNLMAVTEVESAGVVFWLIDGKRVPAARPEAHYFYRLLKGAEREKAVSLGLAHPRYGVIRVPGARAAVYDIIERMKKINETAALKSCSWGLGQVMGENAESLGYSSVQEMVRENFEGPEGQIKCMMRFIKRNGLISALKNGDFTTFAKRYNGPAYKSNAYDTKMAMAAAKYAKVMQGPKAAAVVANEEVKKIQQIMTDMGCYKGPITGLEDQSLRDAVETFQRENGLVVDGKYGKMTADKVEEINQLRDQKNGKVTAAVGITGTGVTSVGQQGLSYVQMLPEHPAFKIAITILTCAFVGVMLYGLYLQFKNPEPGQV